VSGSAEKKARKIVVVLGLGDEVKRVVVLRILKAFIVDFGLKIYGRETMEFEFEAFFLYSKGLRG
jgi:hypothetical protein